MREALLALLAVGPAHGYELKHAYDRAFAGSSQPLNVGQVYTTLQRLERDALVSSRQVEQSDRPNKTVYELTDAGREEVRKWFESDIVTPRLRSEFVTRFVIAMVTGVTDASALVDRQREAHLRTLRDLDRATREGGADAVTRLLIEGAALHIQADLQWLDRCEEILPRRHE